LDIRSHYRDGDERNLSATLQPKIWCISKQALSELGVPLSALDQPTFSLHFTHEDLKRSRHLGIAEPECIGTNLCQILNGTVRSATIRESQEQPKLTPADLLEVVRTLSQQDRPLKMNDASLGVCRIVLDYPKNRLAMTFMGLGEIRVSEESFT
jgi:hypothetical protein